MSLSFLCSEMWQDNLTMQINRIINGFHLYDFFFKRKELRISFFRRSPSIYQKWFKDKDKNSYCLALGALALPFVLKCRNQPMHERNLLSYDLLIKNLYKNFQEYWVIRKTKCLFENNLSNFLLKVYLYLEKIWKSEKKWEKVGF